MSHRLNVALHPGSPAHLATSPPSPRGLAPGFTPNPAWDLGKVGGRTIVDLTFINCYLGLPGAWAAEDINRIDGALSGAFTDADLEGVIAQYYEGPIKATMLPSIRHEQQPPPVFHKNDAEQLVNELAAAGVLGGADPANGIFNIMLPRGIVLSTEPAGAAPPEEPGVPRGEEEPASPGGEEEGAAPGGEESEGHVVAGEDDAVESTEGLGGYHGAVTLPGGAKVLYAVGVYSEGNNGIVAFDEPWKNVVATFYHELNEARTDPDVEEAAATNNDALLGWYSQAGNGEIGDLPINACRNELSLVFKEVPLADGSGTVPIQLMWSNDAHGPAASR
jgi:hypothetical protein